MTCPTPDKTSYTIKEDAEFDARSLPADKKLYVYFCDCGSYHLTSTPPENAPGRRYF